VANQQSATGFHPAAGHSPLTGAIAWAGDGERGGQLMAILTDDMKRLVDEQKLAFHARFARLHERHARR
jgi:hypothetical protein